MTVIRIAISVVLGFGEEKGEGEDEKNAEGSFTMNTLLCIFFVLALIASVAEAQYGYGGYNNYYGSYGNYGHGGYPSYGYQGYNYNYPYYYGKK
ncbi:hypothetical protein QR680_008616 [Steinernema hermaphroditum]|uniref:Uncharacterized protein n=1 Tax=Steinernema hermaphroditum TaxID=289476 RepID=A0AA39IIM5_9BILA|nr:hypothetical protein QR680_008616 [Steinernema hermaphroditum]